MHAQRCILLFWICVFGATKARSTLNSGSTYALPTPSSRASKSQLAVVENVAKHARNASAEATSHVLSAFSSSSFQSSWSRLVSAELAATSPQDLLALIQEEIATVEVVHAFNSQADNPHLQLFREDDINITMAKRLRFYPNVRSVYFGSLRRLDDLEKAMQWKVEDAAERTLMGFPAFTSNKAIPGLTGQSVPWPSSWAEAYNRPIYSGTNIQRRSFPLPQHFGDVQLVFRRRYIDPLSILSPSDTGWKTIACQNHSFPSEGPAPSWRNTTGDRYNCSAWPYSNSAYGLSNEMNHFIIPNIYAYLPRLSDYNVTFGDALARQYARLLDDDAATFDLTSDPRLGERPLIDTMASMYYEFNIAGNVLFDEPSVKLIVASFSDLFGSSFGREVQQWAIGNGWLMAWALSPNNNLVKSCTWRVLDPDVVLALKDKLEFVDSDFRGFRVDKSAFDASWKGVSRVIERSGGYPWNVSFEENVAMWEGLEQSLSSSETMSLIRVPRSRQCRDVDSCIGVAANKKCVCYKETSQLKLSGSKKSEKQAKFESLA